MKFSGKIGFAESEETKPGVWTDQITLRFYTGDILQNNQRYQRGESTNDNINLTNKISILCDNYFYQHLAHIRFVEWMGSKWKVKTMEINRPRVVLEIGDVYIDSSGN